MNPPMYQRVRNMFVDVQDLALATQSIIDFVQANPHADDCVGKIENMGAIPTPVYTDEGRLVFRLQFACIFGD